MKTGHIKSENGHSLRKIIIALCITGSTLFLMNSVSLWAKYAWEKKLVTAKAGLNLRETADPSGKKICTIPSGEIVEIAETRPETVTIGGKNGRWVKILWNNKQGWAFDAFLGEIDTSPLFQHFKSIDIVITNMGCPFAKSAGDVNFAADGGSEAESISASGKPARVNGDSIIFEYNYWKCMEWDSGEDSEPSCVEDETEYYECAIEGKKIFDTKAGGTLKTDAKCKLIRKVKGN